MGWWQQLLLNNRCYPGCQFLYIPPPISPKTPHPCYNSPEHTFWRFLSCRWLLKCHSPLLWSSCSTFPIPAPWKGKGGCAAVGKGFSLPLVSLWWIYHSIQKIPMPAMNFPSPFAIPNLILAMSPRPKNSRPIANSSRLKAALFSPVVLLYLLYPQKPHPRRLKTWIFFNLVLQHNRQHFYPYNLQNLPIISLSLTPQHIQQ